MFLLSKSMAIRCAHANEPQYYGPSRTAHRTTRCEHASSILTLYIWTWAVIHPNVPPHEEGCILSVWRRIKLTLWTATKVRVSDLKLDLRKLPFPRSQLTKRNCRSLAYARNFTSKYQRSHVLRLVSPNHFRLYPFGQESPKKVIQGELPMYVLLFL